MKKIGADECDAAFALTYFLTTPVPVNISWPVLLYLLQFFVIKLCWKGVSR